MISLVVYSDREHEGQKLVCRVEGAPEDRAADAAGMLRAVDKRFTVAVVRFESDVEFLSFEARLGRTLRDRLQGASMLTVAGASFIEWSSDATYADGPGWRGLYTRKQFQQGRSTP